MLSLKSASTPSAPKTLSLSTEGSPPAHQQSISEEVAPWQVQQLLDALAPSISTLSLDCFDTLLWRKTRTPVDVFYDLEQSPIYKKHHLNARLRISSEGLCRNQKLVEKFKSEVDLASIYRQAAPRASETEIEELCQAELEAEKQACFAFPPIVELLLAAKAKGLRVIIVSDTYLSEAELQALLSDRLPAPAYRAIDRVFCSNVTGRSKSGGLFGDVLEALREKPSRLLHLGDNPIADLAAAKHAGLLGVRLRQYEEGVEEHLRLATDGCLLMHPETRRDHALWSIYHGLLAHQPQPHTGAHALGYLGCGPILYGFARFIQKTIEEHRAQGRTVKPVFLLRDGFLPHQVHDALYPEEETHLISISRFVAYACSFSDQKAVMDYLGRSAGSKRWEAMLKQLLVPEKFRKVILRATQKASRKELEFVKQITKPQVLQSIFEEAARFRQRYFRYLEKQIRLQEGDTLLFVDLGYEGTAQRCLSSVFRKERQVDIRGCYMMAPSVVGWHENRVGMLDADFCDERAIATVIPYVAVLEDMCTAQVASVVDFSEEGDPIFADAIVTQEQFERVRPVQEQCIQFAKDAAAFFDQVGDHPTLTQLRYAASGSIARLLFLPTQSELDYLDGFSLDLGLGTEDALQLFDREAGLTGLRHRGLFFMKENQSGVRMNYPYELRSAGIELALTLFVQRRLGLDINSTDLTQRVQDVFVLAVRGDQEALTPVPARATHDGCYSLIVPVGACTFNVGLLFGKTYSSLQLLACELVQADRLFATDESLHTQDLMATVKMEKVEHPGDNILFLGDESFLFISPASLKKNGKNQVIRVVYRPLAIRG